MIDPALNTPRGVRNNNPGNIRRGQALWQGEAGVQGDPQFLVFAEPVWGLRAIAKVLLNYQRHGYMTVRQMIDRWAPPEENDTAAYVADVAAAMAVHPDAKVDLARNPELCAAMVAAIVRHENGCQPYAPELIRQAVALA